MKTFISLVILALFSSGLMGQVYDLNKHAKSKLLTSKAQISILDGRPISFYLNHPSIDKNSKRLYKGELGFSRDSVPSCIMDSLLTINSETRPFYFFIFNQFVDQANGKMIDLVALKCTVFVEKYPCEFFNFFNQPDLDINVVKWTTYIGLTLKDRNGYAEFKSKIDYKIKGNCADIQDLLKSFMTEVRMCLAR